MTTALVLFRRDLRLADNPALHAACEAHSQVLPVFIHEPGDGGEWAYGAAGRWWLHHSLAALDTRLRENHAGLHLRQGDTLDILRELIQLSGATAVYWNRRYEPASIARDRHIKSVLREQGIDVHSLNSALWFEPWQIATLQNEPYKVFTPYWRKLRSQLHPTEPVSEAVLSGWRELPGALSLPALCLLPAIRWDGGLAEAWRPGEPGAKVMFEIFGDDVVNHYAQSRDQPARHGTSRLSAHLHFGEISPRQIHFELDRRAQGVDAACRPDIEPFLRQLGWREFAHHLLFHYPRTPTEDFNPRFADFQWAAPDGTLLARWQQGRTGIPLIDAGMRELWLTGWMHNRVRMIVASFLTKNLRVHWLHGARWFWDTLVDADLANNTLGWQWVAGCGADAAPYFRVFNPVTQGKNFDPEGVYLRRWLPELAGAPLALVHEPWKDPLLLTKSGYPEPMVDLALSRREALAAFQARNSRV
jgi:deoxyribodipyrimidine photo-lyase